MYWFSGPLSPLLVHPPAPTAALLKVGAVLTSTLHRADALQVQLTETMHARTRLITELKEVVAPLCKREQELYNRNTVLAINISLADVQQVMCSFLSQFLSFSVPKNFVETFD